VKAIVYYSDNVPKESFLRIIRKNLKKVSNGIPIVWVTQKPIDEMNNIVLTGIKRSHHSICLQILTGVQRCEADVIYLAEHDVLYHPSHYKFDPPEMGVFYYNTNRWWLRSPDGLASHKKMTRSLSNLVASRAIVEDFYTRRLDLYDRGIKVKVREEPAKHRIKELPHYRQGLFSSKWPNVDIRHKHNYTKSNRFAKDPDYELSDRIPGWGITKGKYKEFLRRI
jgi:hypothetical protein